MKQAVTEFITDYIRSYQERDAIATSYGEPIVGFADAWHPYIQNLKQIISPTHELPQNILPDAKIIIAYYIPFTKDMAKTNSYAGLLASAEWARAYEETNALFAELNEEIICFIQRKKGLAGVTPKAMTFDQSRLISDWSHRHIAYAAGLGTFGLNNMLLTREGCCGRFSSGPGLHHRHRDMLCGGGSDLDSQQSVQFHLQSDPGRRPDPSGTGHHAGGPLPEIP